MAELETIRAPRISATLIVGLQRALNERDILAVAQPRSKGVICAHKERSGDRIVGCGELAAFHHVDEEECTECGKMKKDPDDPFCVAHMALQLADRLQSPQTSLLEVDPATGAVPAQRDHNAEAEDDETGDDEAPEPEPEPETRPVLDGTTGAPIAAETYELTPDPKQPWLCICGFSVESDVASTFHDARHAAYLAEIAAEKGEARPARRTAPRGDVTKAVSNRKKNAKKKTPPQRRGAKA